MTSSVRKALRSTRVRGATVLSVAAVVAAIVAPAADACSHGCVN
jgi:hypothetical protein